MVHDRDNKFSRVFDEAFRSDGVEIIRTPLRAPQARCDLKHDVHIYRPRFIRVKLPPILTAP